MKTTEEIKNCYPYKGFEPEKKWYSKEEVQNIFKIIKRLKMDDDELKKNNLPKDWNHSLIAFEYQLKNYLISLEKLKQRKNL